MTNMGDVLNPLDMSIQRDVAGGVTTANILHGSANAIGGNTVVIKLRWGVDSGRALLFEGAMPGIKFALGENPKRQGMASNTGLRRYPGTRQGVEFTIRDAFTRAKVYQRAWQEYEKTRASNAGALAPRRDLQLDAEAELVVLQRRCVIALLLLARDVTGQRLVGADVRFLLLQLDFFDCFFLFLVVGLSEHDRRDRNDDEC